MCECVRACVHACVRACVRVCVCVYARVCVDQMNFKIHIYLPVHFVLCQCIMFEEVKLTGIILYIERELAQWV